MKTFHKECGGFVCVDLTPYINIEARVKMTVDGVDIQDIDILYTGKSLKEVTYLCKKCGIVLGKPDVVVSCDHCGKFFEPKDLLFVKISGGLILCKEKCYDDFLRRDDRDRENKQLDKVMFKPNISKYNGSREHPALVRLEEEIESAAPRVTAEDYRRLINTDFAVNTFDIAGQTFSNATEAMERIRELASVELQRMIDNSVSDEAPREPTIIIDDPLNLTEQDVREINNIATSRPSWSNFTTTSASTTNTGRDFVPNNIDVRDFELRSARFVSEDDGDFDEDEEEWDDFDEDEEDEEDF